METVQIAAIVVRTEKKLDWQTWAENSDRMEVGSKRRVSHGKQGQRTLGNPGNL